MDICDQFLSVPGRTALHLMSPASACRIPSILAWSSSTSHRPGTPAQHACQETTQPNISIIKPRLSAGLSGVYSDLVKRVGP